MRTLLLGLIISVTQSRSHKGDLKEDEKRRSYPFFKKKEISFVWRLLLVGVTTSSLFVRQLVKHCTFVHMWHTFFDGYCSTVQGLLDWFEVDLGFTEPSFIQIGLCVLCVFVLYSRVWLSSCPFLDILHCLPRAVGVSLESALNLVSRMSPCGAHDTHACCARSNRDSWSDFTFVTCSE